MSPRIPRLAAWCLMLAAACPAAAGSFNVAPVRIDLDDARRTAVLTVHNDDDAPLVIQVSTLAWSQPGGEEKYEDTRDLLVTPPLFTLPPKGEQIVRVALRRGADPRDELSYRVLLAEVPQAANAGFTGLRVALRLSLPVFVRARNPSPALLEWRADARADGALDIRATNHGATHLQVADFELRFAGVERRVHAPVSRYVLPGSSVGWTVQPPDGVPPRATITLHGTGDQGDFQDDVAFASE